MRKEICGLFTAASILTNGWYGFETGYLNAKVQPMVAIKNSCVGQQRVLGNTVDFVQAGMSTTPSWIFSAAKDYGVPALVMWDLMNPLGSPWTWGVVTAPIGSFIGWGWSIFIDHTHDTKVWLPNSYEETKGCFDLLSAKAMWQKAKKFVHLVDNTPVSIPPSGVASNIGPVFAEGASFIAMPHEHAPEPIKKPFRVTLKAGMSKDIA